MQAKPDRFWILLLLTLALAVGLVAQGVDPGTANLTHSWLFEDDTANDDVGGAHGTLVGGATVTEGLLWLSDQGQWMEMPGEVIALNTYSEITLECWYTPFEGANTEYTMLAYFGDSVDGFGADGYFITSARGNDVSRAAISCGVYANPWEGESGVDGIEYDDGVLHHMVSTLTDEEITLYQDGELMGTALLSVNNSIGALSTNYAYLGRGGYTVDPNWIGDIHEFSIYNRALSEDEILFLFLKGPGTSAVEEKENAGIPSEYGLLQNYPNPFNPVTTIPYLLSGESSVRIAVYDVLGREVATLVDGVMPAGRHTVQFDARNLDSGMYICRMDVGGKSESRRMLLLK
ncbi:MAG TPA: T9SS type A sorting domain-containing protein [bacterium]|nr:T9SS type A sorting domain-containing protein [bacterium]